MSMRASVDTNTMPSVHAAEVASSSQPWCQKHRKPLLCAAVLIIGVVFASIGIVILVGNSNNEPIGDSSTAITSDAAAANPGWTFEEEDEASSEDNGQSQDGSWQWEDSNASSLNNSPSASTVEYYQQLRGTDMPTQSPSRDPTFYPTATTTLSAQTIPKQPPLTFYAMGDVPYSDMEACLLPHELEKLSSAEGRFLVHLGDIRDGRPGRCTEAIHERVAGIFESSPVPTFFVIGDNGWLDCGGNTAYESFTYWEKHLLPFHERTDLNWPALDANVARHPDHPEFFAFSLENVLFLGQGLPVPQKANMPHPDWWQYYLDENAKWTRDRIRDAKNAARDLRAVVIFAHSSGGAATPYYDELKNIASSYPQIPILFMEDSHLWGEFTYEKTPNLYRLAMDDTVTATSITIDTEIESESYDITNVFRYDRRCPCSSGHRPTGLMRYDEGECVGVCDTNEFCFGENDCGTDGAGC